MTAIVTPPSAAALDTERAERLDRELAEAEGVTRMLRQHLELLASVNVPPSGGGEVYRLVCGESAKVATAMSRLRSAHAASLAALARLRDAGQPRRVVIEHRYVGEDDENDGPGDAA